jgi:inosine-uridine nucleoside N-ribohydrolase
MTVKVLLDTDIGSDIDDAVCLAYLLSQPDCELLGITTVSGEATTRAMLASALCRVAGRQIPILPGVEEPLLIPQLQPDVPQAAALERWPHDRGASFPRGQAVEFLRRTIQTHPGEIILLAIGPLTNIALLFRVDAAIPSLLRGLVLVCGAFVGRPKAEPAAWNARLDPHAAAIAYRASVPTHRSIGLDVTERVTMPADEVRRRCRSRILRTVLDFADAGPREDVLTFHDPLAAATIFNDRICALHDGTVEVDLSREDNLGTTIWMPGAPGAPHQVAQDVDVDRFFEHYFAVVRDDLR